MYINNIKETQDNEGKIIRIDIQISNQIKINIDKSNKSYRNKLIENELYGLVFYNNDNTIEYYLSTNENANLILLGEQKNKEYNCMKLTNEFEQLFTKIYE